MGNKSFSIIVPTYGRPKGLGNCLKALSRLNYPPDNFEVIVVDDGSETHLSHVCEPFQNKVNIKLISQPNSGPAAARNKGAEHAKGRFLAFTDDDCIPLPNWLNLMEVHLNERPDCAVAGKMVNVFPENPYSMSSQILIDFLHDYYNKKSNGAKFLTTSSLGVSAKEFREIGGFDTSFPRAAAEDRDFCARWLHSGKKVVFDSNIRVQHGSMLSMNTYLKQHFNYGRGAFRFHEKCSLRGQWSFRVEPLVFYKGLFLYPIFTQNVKSKAYVLFLLFVSQVANTLGFWWEKINRNKN
ncbi:glycosyltransferase [Thermodesulfobacteriota bacterium]